MCAALTSDRPGHASQCIAYASVTPAADMGSPEEIAGTGGGAICNMLRTDRGKVG